MNVVAAAQNIASEAKCLVDKMRGDADVSSPPILGQGTESSVHHLLSRLLPQRFGLGWGMLTNQEGEQSPQVDTMWLRVFLAFCAGLLAPSFIPSIGHMSDGLPKGTTTHFLPLALAADAERSDQQDYVIHEALRLATWFREDE